MNPALTTASPPAQRWKYGKNYWRVDRDEGFRKHNYVVDEIKDSLAKKFVVEHHYSGSYPFAMERVGLFEGTKLVGVAIFSIPINNSVIPKYTGQHTTDGAELGRFVLLDEVPYNAESFFLSRAFKALQLLRPGIKAVVAYSDPVPRTTSTGNIVLPGHIGIAYQACNALYMGRASSKTLHITPSGIALSSRAISKIRLQEHGASSAEKRLVMLGAEQRRFGQDPAEWIQQELNSGKFRKIRHAGNHIYAWPLGTQKNKQALVKVFATPKKRPKTHDLTQQNLDFEEKTDIS